MLIAMTDTLIWSYNVRVVSVKVIDTTENNNIDSFKYNNEHDSHINPPQSSVSPSSNANSGPRIAKFCRRNTSPRISIIGHRRAHILQRH